MVVVVGRTREVYSVVAELFGGVYRTSITVTGEKVLPLGIVGMPTTQSSWWRFLVGYRGNYFPPKDESTIRFWRCQLERAPVTGVLRLRGVVQLCTKVSAEGVRKLFQRKDMVEWRTWWFRGW